MNPSSRMAPLLLFLLLAACSPPAPSPVPSAQPTQEAPQIPPASPTPATTPSRTPVPPATATPTATPLPAPGTVAIAVETLGQLRSLWSREFIVEEADERCFLTDCYAPFQVYEFAISRQGDRLALPYCEQPRENRSDPYDYQFYCESPSYVLILDPRTGEETQRLEMAEFPLSVALHPERPILAAGLANRDIEIWDFESSTRLRTLYHSTETTGVTDLEFSPSGEWLASEGDRKVQLWSWEEAPFLRATIERVRRLAFNPDGSSLATVFLGDVERVRLYQLPFNDRFAELPVEGAPFLAFSPEGSLLAAEREGFTRLFELETRELVEEFRSRYFGERTYLHAPALFTPTGLLLWRLDEYGDPDSGGFTCGPLLWDPSVGQGSYAPPPGQRCSEWDFFDTPQARIRRQITPDGRLLVVLKDGELQAWGVDPAQPPVEPICMGACGEG